MEKEPPNSSLNLLGMSFSAIPLACFYLFLAVAPLHAQSVENNDIPKQREIHNTFSGDQESGAILDATNPMDLINRLKKATAMENATSPSDAIDEALKAFDPDPFEKAISE